MYTRSIVVTVCTAGVLLLTACQPVRPVPEGAGATTAAGETGIMTATATLTGTPEITGTVGPIGSVEVTETEEITGMQDVTGTGILTADQGLVAPGLQAPEFVVVVTENEFVAPETVPAGWTRVVVENQEEEQRDLILVKLQEGRTADDLVALLDQPDTPIPEWVELYGGTLVEPAGRNSYLVDLTPGDYVYLSMGQGEVPPVIGTLEVTEVPAAAGAAVEPPEPDVTVGMVDYSFVVSDTLPAGEQTFFVQNNGDEAHHLVILRLQEGATFEDLQPFLSGEAVPAGEPPVEEAGFSGDISPGIGVYFAETLTPGDYVFICFLPNPEGIPHFALGMIRQVTVE